ncbi:ABC transporter ATP-binding protein [Bacillus sp. FJAT-28004]|uniref:ABC transporter ATP-binding protein n=1 Tax=Bacillus sp. FJAT-28004 TaxID=1679165 RepID=UPI0006B4DAE0|nr:ABC transporter ATP-binding protein [Bacillus sp. FJAT-28004]
MAVTHVKIQSLHHSFTKKVKLYFWIISFVGKYRAPFIILILTGFITSGVLLAIPKFLQYVIDSIIPAADYRRLMVLMAILTPFIALMLVSMAVRNLVQRIVQEKSASDLQMLIFTHLRKLGFSYYEEHPIGETLSMFQAEIPAIQNIYRRYLPVLIEKMALLILSLFLMLSIHASLTLLVIPFFLSYYLVGPYFEKKQSQFLKDGSQSRTEYNKKIYDSLSGLMELRIHRAEKWDLNRLLEKYNTNRKLWMNELLYALLRGTARRMTINLGALALFLFGAFAVRNGTLNVGEFVAFLLYYFHVMGDLTRVITMITEQSMLLMQGEKLYDLVHQRPLVDEDEQAIRLEHVKGHISIKDVHFAYNQMPDRDILRGLTLEILPGQRVAFVGSSGGGKSTILKLLGRFYDPKSGVIQLDGHPIRALQIDQLRNTMGFVFQETYLFGSSIKENILFGNPEASDEELIAAAKAANAHEFIVQMPDGYETSVGERGMKLSGGQKQRIAIARMLLKNPPVILLDEATSALDNISEKEVQLALDRLMEGRTTVAIAHRLTTIRHYDLIAVVNEGMVAELGSYDDLYARKGLFYQLAQGGERLG